MRRTSLHEYETVIDRFHTEMNAAVHVTVEYPERENIKRPDGHGTSERGSIDSHDRARTPEVVWNVIRTMTDPGAQSWTDGDAGQAEALPASQPRAVKTTDFLPSESERVMVGRISFVPRRSPADLKDWRAGARGPADTSATSPSARPPSQARL